MLKFLSIFHCYPAHNISVVIDDSAKYLGFYYQRTITLRSNVSDRVIVHELYHSCQKEPSDEYEWDQMERKARHIERLWVEWLL